MKSPISISNDIKSLFNEIGRESIRIWNLQVPVDSGDLKRSLSYRIVQNANGILLIFGYLEYGMFVDLGTGPYSDQRSYGLSPFEMPAWNRSPGIGRYGIKPRYWTSLSGSRINFEEELSIIIETVIDNIIPRT